jgi:GcrA cell cycle regulator
MMPNHDWTQERDEQLAAFWRDGLTTAEIGRRLGVSKNSVIGRAHRLQLPRRASPINVTLSQPWTEADDALLRRIYGGFLTAAEIAARMGRSLHAIAYRASILGLKAKRRALPQSRAMVARPAARAHGELPKLSETRAASPSRPGAATRCSGYRVTRAVTQPGAAATTALCPSSLNSPGAVAETPPRRVFSRACCFPMWRDKERATHIYCEAPVVEGADGKPRQYCAAHYAECYTTPAKNPTNPPPAGWLKNRLAMRAHG